MALVLALARGGVLGPDLPAGGGIRDRLGVLRHRSAGLIGLCGIFAAALAAATIYCTGMIYASLKPIRQWHNRWVVPNYFLLGLMGGFLVLDFLVRLWAPAPERV